MTEKRILEIISDLTCRTGVTVKALQLAKQVAEIAVNEAIEECAIKVDTKYIESDTNMNPGEVVVDRNSILNLKVK